MSAWRVGSGILYLIDKHKHKHLKGMAPTPSANECNYFKPSLALFKIRPNVNFKLCLKFISSHSNSF